MCIPGLKKKTRNKGYHKSEVVNVTKGVMKVIRV